MSNYGIKISKDGYDVKTATPDQLVYSSKYSNLKIFGVYTATVTISGTAGFTTIANPLGYPPLFMAYFDVSHGSGKYREMTSPGTIYYDLVDYIPAFCLAEYNSSTDELYFSVIGGTDGQQYDVKCVVFVDKLY
jgi:hypothetical protein